MSLSLIAFQPAIDEPSNMVPSVRKSSSTRSMSKVTCCILPRMSVKRTSTYLTSFSLIRSRMSLAVGHGRYPLAMVSIDWWSRRRAGPVSPVRMRMTSRISETKILPSPMRPVRAAPDGLERAVELVVGDHHLDLDLGQEVHDVLGAAVELGLALLAAVALGLDDGHALDAQLLQGLLHLVQLERLDDGFDLFHDLPRYLEAPPGPPWRSARTEHSRAEENAPRGRLLKATAAEQPRFAIAHHVRQRRPID